MSETIKFVEPLRVHQGTTIKWKRALSDYPASASWVLTYNFRGPGTFDVTSVADGDNHSVVIASTVSAAYPAGDYTWQAFVANGAERHFVGKGLTTVKADFALAPAGFDARSHVKKTLDMLEAAIEGSASTDVLSYSIGDRTISRIPKGELIQLHSHYRALYAKEKKADRIRRGLGTNRRIGVRFV